MHKDPKGHHCLTTRPSKVQIKCINGGHVSGNCPEHGAGGEEDSQKEARDGLECCMAARRSSPNIIPRQPWLPLPRTLWPCGSAKAEAEEFNRTQTTCRN
ncbi:rCG25468, isoform CRA_b [Rattus norvegicus]|uniref:RCG25468, isoform CRA_b n=1 Tax=Rattus norvegicus TaxID=10116 RepID=A6I406_RAT|nr:rCG25468, isoform CRA_b [Rattus norvegicus]EDL76874.1 rCG25468, isoform CRA_b [Rattus norvegicus]